MTTPAAELGTVRFAYTDRDVLKGAGFMLAPGQFAVLVGQNGSGKSTIIKLLLGQIAPRGGCVQVCGERPAHAVAHGCVGYVPQQSPDDYRHFPLTVMEMVRTTAPGQGLVRRGRSRALCAARRAIAQAGLAGREDALVGELSGGLASTRLGASSAAAAVG